MRGSFLKPPITHAILAHMVGDRQVTVEVSLADLETSMKSRGAHERSKVTSPYAHAELQGLPRFTGWDGPRRSAPGKVWYSKVDHR